jgi:hypothetical protein
VSFSVRGATVRNATSRLQATLVSFPPTEEIVKLLLALLLFVAPASVFAQSIDQLSLDEITLDSDSATPETFGLKGDVIGESLDDFKARNAATLNDGVHSSYPRCSGDVPNEIRPQSPDPSGAGTKIYMRQFDAYMDASRAYIQRHDATQLTLDGMATKHVLGADKVCIVGAAMTGIIAGFGAEVEYYFRQDHLDRIDGTLPSTYFDSVGKAIKAKYGDPSSARTESYQNRMGASFTGEVDTWESEKAVILFTQVGGDVDHSHLSIFNPETVKILKDAQDKNAIESF